MRLRRFKELAMSFFKINKNDKKSLNELYPEIAKAGGLSNALNKEFEKLNSSMRAIIDEDLTIKLPFAYSRVEHKKKFSQIYIATEEKLYLPDYWRAGVCIAHGKTDKIELVAESLDYWLTSEQKTKLLSERFKFVIPDKKAEVFDNETEVEYTWNLILNDEERKGIKSFVELAIKDEVLKTLFPFTSLMTLCFSRFTGYPYTYDTPTVSPTLTGEYIVRLGNDKIIGQGSAFEALMMVKDNLPKDIKPAIRGTTDDLLTNKKPVANK
jgi:hypothetical protein